MARLWKRPSASRGDLPPNAALVAAGAILMLSSALAQLVPVLAAAQEPLHIDRLDAPPVTILTTTTLSTPKGLWVLGKVTSSIHAAAPPLAAHLDVIAFDDGGAIIARAVTHWSGLLPPGKDAQPARYDVLLKNVSGVAVARLEVRYSAIDHSAEPRSWP
ncbi:hypothetical protein [Caulobacter sp. RHG1]|uniref:hypothetical protein n=1 Tax=Caulobacter sp. (strain RHG1) TaxID=2545762 RepID=UPI001554EF17|nr:hypothetical protein [Caulobacter sp. RHG1]NQE64324.1 hypothetical protein [Caulobacter sp. RHG1]